MHNLYAMLVLALAIALPTWAKEQGYTPQALKPHLPFGLSEWDGEIFRKMGLKPVPSAMASGGCQNDKVASAK